MKTLNLQEIDQEQALNIAKFFIRSNENVFFFGKRGVGKTQIAIKAIEDSGYKVNYINLAVIERVDLAGYPNLFSDSKEIQFKSPYYLPELTQDKADTVILFDEIDKAPPEITSPLLEILQFKKINGKKINVAACILTGNLLEENVYSNTISTALLDRGSKYILSFNFEKWIDWANLNGIHDLILGFLRKNPELASYQDDECYASPSPRGWTLASNALFKAKELKISNIDFVTDIISGFVGKEAGLKFKIWYEYFKKFETYIYPLIENGFLNLNFKELSKTEQLIFVLSCCHYTKQKILQNNTKNISNYLENLCSFLQKNDVDQEIQVMGFYNSFNFEFITKYKLYSHSLFFNHFKKINENVTFKK